MKRKLVYVCSPLRGEVERNIKRAIGYSRLVYQEGHLPITPHAYLTLFLDDSFKDERQHGIMMGLQLLEICDEIWVFGKKITEGMTDEIHLAKKLEKNVLYFDENAKTLEV